MAELFLLVVHVKSRSLNKCTTRGLLPVETGITNASHQPNNSLLNR
jgi:hypothetical protein